MYLLFLSLFFENKANLGIFKYLYQQRKPYKPKKREKEMTTPTSQQIKNKAIKMFNEHNQHLPSITPTNSEFKESGLYFEARNQLMSNEAKHEALGFIEQQALELGYRLTPTHEYEDTTPQVHNSLLFDLEEAKRSNILVSGANRSGKTLLSCSIASVLMRLGWRVVCFDSSSVWKNVSDIPLYYEVKPSEYFFQIPTTNESIVYDISALIPERQKTLVDFILRDLWNNRGTIIYEKHQRLTKSKPL